MILRVLTPEELAAAYERDFQEAFPPAELKPLEIMERMRDRGVYDPLGYFDEDGTIAGYIFLWKHTGGQYILIDYLCVPAGRRSNGIGGKLLSAVRSYYPPGTVFIGESEAPTGDPNTDAMILRRLGFYRRNGAVTLGYDCALFGVHYKTIVWADPVPDENEVLKKHQEIYLEQFDRVHYDAFIQLPLAPGEAPRPLTKWLEN